MKRVLIIGNPGSGKSTLATRLGPLLGLPVIHLDQHYWTPGWIEAEKDEWHRKLDDLLAGDEWVMDGNYSSSLTRRLERADTVIWLDFPLRSSLWRITKRIIMSYGRVRPDMAPDCPERFDLEFFVWAARFPIDTRPGMLTALAKRPEGVRLFALRNQEQIDLFLERRAWETKK